jgi:hypothetical protein
MIVVPGALCAAVFFLRAIVRGRPTDSWGEMGVRARGVILLPAVVAKEATQSLPGVNVAFFLLLVSVL